MTAPRFSPATFRQFSAMSQTTARRAQRVNLLPLCRFLASDKNREWLKFGPLSVYCRKQLIPVSEDCRQSLTYFCIASVECSKEGQGYYTGFMKALQKFPLRNCGMSGIYIETVSDIRFIEFHKRHGFTVHQCQSVPNTIVVNLIWTPS